MFTLKNSIQKQNNKVIYVKIYNIYITYNNDTSMNKLAN